MIYQDTDGSTRYFHYDYRGSTIALSNAEGAVVGRVGYGPYGEPVERTGDTSTTFLFVAKAGVETDASGLIYMRARYYDPLVGRFVNADPAGLSAGLNFFTYVSGDPISRTDPLGLRDWGGVFTSSIGIVGNSLGIVATLGLAAAPDPTVTKVAAVVIGLKSAYGLGVNVRNFQSAWNDEPLQSTGALTNDIARSIFPNSDAAQYVATGVDIATDVAGGLVFAARLAPERVGPTLVVSKRAMGTGTEFSHSVPYESAKNWPSWLERSLLNGNIVDKETHALTDIDRMLKGMKAQDKAKFVAYYGTRIPYWLRAAFATTSFHFLGKK